MIDPEEPARGRVSMTPADALEKWQPRLRLADWRIAFSTMPPDTNDRSSIDMDVRIKAAVIRLRDDTPDSQIERQVVHELLHALLSGMEDTFIAAKQYTSKMWDEVGDTMWDRGCEFAIEAITDALTGTQRRNWERPDWWTDAFPVHDA